MLGVLRAKAGVEDPGASAGTDGGSSGAGEWFWFTGGQRRSNVKVESGVFLVTGEDFQGHGYQPPTAPKAVLIQGALLRKDKLH